MAFASCWWGIYGLSQNGYGLRGRTLESVHISVSFSRGRRSTFCSFISHLRRRSQKSWGQHLAMSLKNGESIAKVILFTSVKLDL